MRPPWNNSTAPDPRRLVGGAALALVASIVLQNAVVIGAGAPGYDDPLNEVLAFHAQHRAAVGIAVGLEALNVPLLLGFLVGLHGLVVRRGGTGVDWSRLAVAAGAAASAVFAVYAVLWNGVVLAADKLAEPSPELELVWQLHAAAFALALPALGTTFVGAALAGHASGLTQAWQRAVGVVGGALMLIAGVGSLAVADGSPFLLVGVAGYAAWIVWLLASGVRLFRARPEPVR